MKYTMKYQMYNYDFHGITGVDPLRFWDTITLVQISFEG